MFEDSINERSHHDYDFWADEPMTTRSSRAGDDSVGEAFDDLAYEGVAVVEQVDEVADGWNGEGEPQAVPTEADVRALASRMEERGYPEGFEMPDSIGVVGDDGQVHTITREQPDTPETNDEEGDAESGNIDDVIERAMAEAHKPVEVTEDQLADADKVSRATVVFELNIKQATFTRKLAPEQIIADQHQPAADAKMLKSTKKLIVCRELDAIEHVRREFKDWLELYKCRTKMLRGGMALIPLGHMDAVEQRYLRFKEQYYAAVRAFLAVYLEAKREAKDRLGVLYDERQYPSVHEVADAFKVSHRWIAFDAPKAMKGIRTEMIAAARQKIQADLAEAAGEMKDQMRGKMMEFTHWLVGQLQPTPDGKRRQITETKFEQMQEFLRTASTLNVIGDDELDRAIEMANKAIKGVDVKDLKAGGKDRATADQLRQQMAEAFEQVKAVTEGWVVNQTRVFLDEV